MSDFHAQRGIWQDRSLSPIYGSTLTLNTRDANFLVSALTVAVTISASCFWIIISFVLHQCLIRHKSTQTDVFALQQQVILRNSSSPLRLVWDTIQMQLAWTRGVSGKPKNVWRRSMTIAVPALIVWIAFTFASLFVSQVASKSSGPRLQALLQPKNCGLYFGSLTSIEDLRRTISARAYSNIWYSNSSQNLGLSYYPVSTISYTKEENDICPFKNTVCRNSTAYMPSLTLKTPFLDSHEILGINAPPKDRLQLQKLVTCSVLRLSSDEFVKWNETYIQFYLGPLTNQPPEDPTFKYNTVLADPDQELDYLLL